jgi:feruloyl esterase
LFNDPTFDLTSFDLHADLPILDRLRWMLDATNIDLSAFRTRGGKVLMSHGWADPRSTRSRRSATTTR